MTHVNDLVSTETAGRPPSPGFLLTPFGWAAEPLAAMAAAEPSLLPDLFGISRPRMHLIALALAHLDRPVPSGVGCLLARGPAGKFLVGCWAPVRQASSEPWTICRGRCCNGRTTGASSIFSPTPAVQRSSTMRPRSTTWRSRFLATCRRRCADRWHPPWRIGHEKLNGLTAGLQFLVSRGVAGTVDELVAELAKVTAWPQLAAMHRVWVGQVAAT